MRSWKDSSSQQNSKGITDKESLEVKDNTAEEHLREIHGYDDTA